MPKKARAKSAASKKKFRLLTVVTGRRPLSKYHYIANVDKMKTILARLIKRYGEDKVAAKLEFLKK